MDSQIPLGILKVLDGLESGGYEDFMNYTVIRRLLSRRESALTRLFDRICKKRPQMDMVNLVCTVNGALNYVVLDLMSVDEAISLFGDVGRFDAFVACYGPQLEEVALARSNNPTIPQRAFPVACHLPLTDAPIGMLELGCSRGDIGLVLLYLDQVLEAPSKYFFPGFIDATSDKDLQRVRPIARYFGIDLEIPVDDAWLLSLWGLRDERRQQLGSFYADLKPRDSSHFKRLQADACEPSIYMEAALGFLAASKWLVIVTSFMVYQLSPKARNTLVEAIRVLQIRFLAIAGNSAATMWLNQGLDPVDLMAGEFDFSRCYLSKLWFDGDVLLGLPVARLCNDACEGWDDLDGSPVVVARSEC